MSDSDSGSDCDTDIAKAVYDGLMESVSSKMSELSDFQRGQLIGAQLAAASMYEKKCSPSYVAYEPQDVFSDVIYEDWSKIPVSLKKEAAQLMFVYTFWTPILLVRQENNSTTRWAVDVGFIDENEHCDLKLNRLYRIEVLEAILRALEKGCTTTESTIHLVWIGNKFHLHASEVFDDAIYWLERTGEPCIRQKIYGLGHIRTCFMVLEHIFTQYAQYIHDMGLNYGKTMKRLAEGPSRWDVEKSEELKNLGNENFEKKKYEAAVKYYTKAIQFHPKNHIIYGNRALCYIRCEKYLKAVGDGKRAILIQPMWAKGHYRYCEALFALKEHNKALIANKYARRLCKEDRDGSRDLEQQHHKFITAQNENVVPAMTIPTKRLCTAGKLETSDSKPQSAKTAKKFEPATTSSTSQSKVSEVKKDSQANPGKKDGSVPQMDYAKDEKKTKSEKANKTGASAKKKTKAKKDQSKEKTAGDSGDCAGICDVMRSAVKDGHAALADQRSRNAEQAFSLALSFLETVAPKDLGLSTLDVIMLIYGRALALTQIGQSEELAEALREFERIKTFEERNFQCLVFYGIGKVYLKENRFPMALGQFSDSLQMVRNQITPGKLTWPLTTDIVLETEPGRLKAILEEAIETCKFPPMPNAICRHLNCTGHSKVDIYFTDPDFKGFIQMVCSEDCTVEYHVRCWKTLKVISFAEKNEKDFLQEQCFTPDCRGKICSIKIYNSTGLIKWKFETVIQKVVGPKKLKVNQKCTSRKKLKAKEDRKLNRKQHRRASQDHRSVNEDLTENENTAVQSPEKASTPWQLYRDRVLLQISQSHELLAEENVDAVTALMTSLKPWVELDQLNGNELAASIISGQRQPETLGQVVELLLARKNRVWARVFIQALCTCQDINPQLHNWALQLDNSGLKAAKDFIERYSEHLEELDLGPLINFSPLQDMLIEKFGTMPEFFSRRGLTVTEYLKQAPSQEMRLFIWTLEEHRERYASCHPLLDEYFEMMDGHRIVLKKSDNENDNSPHIKTKNRGRKKKQKETKLVLYKSGMMSSTPVDGDDIFDEDDPLIFPDSSDPFSVPDHLRDQVADFEGQFNCSSYSSFLKKMLDNNPDPTKESLYDYFAQVLEEHGPLEAQDPLLVGQLDDFPPVAQQKIQEAGGLEPFLLESLRFVLMGHHIGLSKHAVSMLQAEHGGLNDMDVIGDNNTNTSAFDSRPRPVFQSYLQDVCSAPPEPYLTLPSPYVLGPHVPHPTHNTGEMGDTAAPWRRDYVLDQWASGDPEDASYSSVYDLDCVDIYDSEEDEDSVGKTAHSLEGNNSKKPADTQDYHETRSDVAVNTMAYKRFEANNGDMTKLEKHKEMLHKQIQTMVTGHNTKKQQHQETITSLEQELEKINANIQVTIKELVLIQQKLEDEVKRDQKEKRENQETLKTLKADVKEVVEKVESLKKSIREKKNLYDTKFNDFLELSNISAGEKMSLEDEIKRCNAMCTKASKRSLSAELSILKSRKQQDMYCLYKSLNDGRAILAKLEELAPSYPPQYLSQSLHSWRACVQEAEEKISSTEAQFNKWMEQVKKGQRLSGLPQVYVPSAPTTPALPMLFLPPVHQPQHPSSQTYGNPVAARGPVPGHQAATQGQQNGRAAAVATWSPGAGQTGAPRQHKVQAQPSQGARPPELQPKPVFDRVLDHLSTMFPDYSRSTLKKLIQQLRTANNGSLSSLDYQEVITGVTQIILDSQEQINSTGDTTANPVLAQGAKSQQSGTPLRSDSPASTQAMGTPTPSHVWQAVGTHRLSQTKALNMEDPCIICHDDMFPEDTCVLECRHTFHLKCIRSWLKEQSTCPTCREHALLPEDFPMLPGRNRRGHTPTPFS